MSHVCHKFWEYSQNTFYNLETRLLRKMAMKKLKTLTANIKGESTLLCNLPPEYFLAAGRGDIIIINMKEIRFDGFHHFAEKFCLGIGFSSQLSLNCKCRVTHQCQQTQIMHICKPNVLGFKGTKVFVSFLATFHLKDLRET